MNGIHDVTCKKGNPADEKYTLKIKMTVNINMYDINLKT